MQISPDRSARALGRERPSPANIDDLIARGAYAAALGQLLPRLQSGDMGVATLDRAAQCYWGLDDGETAIALMNVLVGAEPGLVSAWTKLAAMAASLGRTDEARRALDAAMAIGPKTAGMLALLNRLEPIRRNSSHMRRLKTIADQRETPAPDRAAAMNTLGRIEDRAGRNRAAFRWFGAAKAAFGEDYRPCEITSMIATQILKFDPALLPDPQPGLPRMVFVVGMPRSGTTLVESILARHPQVRALGESQALSRTVMAMRRQIARYRGGRSAWDWYRELDAGKIDSFRQLFLSQLPMGAAQDPRVLISKMPLDCLDMGAARVLLPEARFIHLDRHPLDVGLSNFMTNFHEGNAFSRRLDWIGHMIRSVDRSVDDYERKLGPCLHRQSYRALVRSPDRVVPGLLAHAGLDWDPACLHPEGGERIIRTASLSQVREPINKKGLGKWEAYEPHLGPLVDALGGPDQVNAWEARDMAACQETQNAPA